ncbi:MAG TPA: hypothetical protein VE621_18915 [Bryobacteraceae bacterium]|nr:hypothetical protein [Bryobacteraceae bacterium]
MSVRLSGPEGELLSVRVSVAPRLLEDLLECLAGLPFPVNPQLYHGVPTVVEFPAYSKQLGQVQKAVGDWATVSMRPILVASTAA